MNAALNNSFASTLNYIPGTRIVGNFLMRFYKNFDRLEFYYYRRQNLTIFADIFLSSIFNMQQEKGTMLEMLVDFN